ncbi:MAG: DUF3874 domain-containing protein [Geobacteraceae bacterium]|nr:DUF3874 domain-containing protein [Geobacteraceae bacterium]
MFRNCRSTTPVQKIDLVDVLHKIRGGYWQDEYFAYRSGKLEKEKLPCFSPSACFSGGRKRENLVSHSGVINIDIDAQHNEQHDLPALRAVIYADKYIYAGHLSVSGRGLSLYIKINSEKHHETFLSIEKYFAEEYRIVIDPSCKDVSRLRFVSYDDDLYLNDRASKYTKAEKKEAADFQRRKVACCDADVEHVLQQIERDRRDLTENYAAWVKIGFALHGEFGPNGEEFFHRISQFHPKYNRQDCSRKYRQCSGGGVGIASFFWAAKEAGYEIVAPRSREVLKAARYAKKSAAAGIESAESARDGAVRQAVEMHGETLENATKLVSAVFDGASEAEKESADEVYEFIKKDIERKKLRRNLIDDCIEYEGEKLTDRIVNRFMVELRSKYGASKVKRDVVMELVDTSAKDYNPIIEFFEKNRHKNPKGCIDSVIDAISGKVDSLSETQAREFRRYFVRKWLIGMVSGWHGTYSLLTLVLVGDQGTGKSKWFRGLFPEDLRRYYAEAKMDGDKDHLTLMATKALILDDEFGGKSRHEANLFKEISSKQEITIRKPYARMAETHQRIAALAGTTNDENIKGDLTGNRRILAVHVSGIDWEQYYAVDKGDLLIELYKEWKTIGEGWMMTTEDIAMLNNATDRYREVCPEEELLEKYFDAPDKTVQGAFMSATEILNELSGKLSGSSIKLSLKKLGQVLKKSGYTFKGVKLSGTTRYLYNIQRKVAVSESSNVSSEPLPF